MNRRTRSQILAWEGKWFLPTGLATFAVVALLIIAAVVISSVSGEGEAELLHKAAEHSSDVTLSSILEAIGFVLMVAPLYFLFRAAASRSDKMRYQLVGLVIAAPLFFAASAVTNAASTNEAADQFEAGQAKSTLTAKEAAVECRSDLKDEGGKDFNEKWDEGASPSADCADTKVEDDEAENALSDASMRGLATGLGLGGRLGLAVALFYSCLYGMRTGLLSRFWGSLGMALGVAALLLLVQFTLIFFLYFAVLLIGKIPGGRPPAWAAGEAIPWPSPGEKMAAQMEPSDPDAIDVDVVEDEEPSPPDNGNGGPRKKRKKRG
ncbi:MAG TPA: hypothetical protein VLL27_10380 [Solirubrobacterales bacterium]|nr:hypothetical protein [Solirubrobacterales bacterium]